MLGDPLPSVYRREKVKLWKLPAKSPDLNPIEKFWAWLRKELRRRDFADLRAGRPALGKSAYRERVRLVCRTKKAQRVAINCVDNLREVCKAVDKRRGGASDS